MTAPPKRIWKTGDRVLITSGSIRLKTAGMVAMASSNGVSLMLAFEGMVWAAGGGAYLGMMPVMWTGEFFEDLIAGGRVDLEDAD